MRKFEELTEEINAYNLRAHQEKWGDSKPPPRTMTVPQVVRSLACALLQYVQTSAVLFYRLMAS